MSLISAGKRQAALLAERLSERLSGGGPVAVQTSPRERARATAEIIAGRCGAPVDTVDALDEIDFGDWTSRPYADLESDPRWRSWNEARGEARCPGGESMSEAADRIAAHAKALAHRRPGVKIVLVSHADMVRGLIARVLGLPLDNMLRLEIAPASVSRIEIGDWGGCLHSLNETGHLAGVEAG